MDLIKAAAEIIKNNGSKFENMGYADCYNEAADNERLRSERAANVAQTLKQCDVNEGHFTVTTNDSQLNSGDTNIASLNRAVTIKEIPFLPR